MKKIKEEAEESERIFIDILEGETLNLESSQDLL